MKKAVALFLTIAMLLSGCSAGSSPASQTPSVSVEVTPSAASAAPSQNSSAPDESVALPEAEQLAYVVQEYGDCSANVYYGEYFYSTICYPTFNIPDVDAAIKAWADEMYVSASNDVATALGGSRAKDEEGSLTVTYNSYLVNDRFVSVEEYGFFTYSHLAHPQEPVKTFILDLQTQSLIPNEEIFVAGATDHVLTLLRQTLIDQQGVSAEALQGLDASWLENPLLRDEGVEIVLERGRYLPASMGTQKILLPYDALGDALTLAGALDENQPVQLDPTLVNQPILIMPVAEQEAPDELPADEELQSTAVTAEPLSPANSPAATGESPAVPPRELDPDKPMVALTFDDGPSKTTPEILALLDQYGGRATFCMVGNRIYQYSNVVQQIADQGSEVASHTWDHKKLTTLSKAEIRQQLQSTSDAIYAACGVRPLFVRPPYGAYNDDVKAVAAELGIPLLNWSIDTLDWKTKDAQATYQTILDEVKDGSIILCHDLHEETGEAMKLVIPALIEKGYQLVTASELLSTQGTIEPGKVYRHR